MGNKNVTGAAQIAGGGYLGYQAVKHGLPRAVGIRIEYHTTSKANAELIKKAGNILDPAFGGKNGWAAKVKNNGFIEHSKNFVHITGLHKDSIDMLFSGKNKALVGPFGTFSRISSNFLYKTVGNGNYDKICKPGQKKEAIKSIFETAKDNILHNKTKRFCIPGIDSYFNKEFIPDIDSYGALKSNKPIKAYTNRFSAMVAGLKEFGLKGIKENKGRAIFGAAILALGLYVGFKLISNGIKTVREQNEKNDNQ